MLVAKNITKKFSGVTALNNVNIELHPGKVNAIIGENGAGKSTLMKILSGVFV
ncbi:MAG: ATP-binding cassette domain-containing protein, partial [Chitinophagaceae bacterium]